MKKPYVIVILLTVYFFFPFFAKSFAKTALDMPTLLEPISVDEESQDYDQVIAGIKREIQVDPYNYENYGHLAFIYDYIGDYENELEALKLEVKYLPEDIESKDVTYGNLARAYILTGQSEQAKAWLDKADKINSNNIFNRWHSLTYHILKNNSKIAAKELKRLNELDATDRDHYYEAYIYAFENIEDQDLIIELFQQAVTVNPDCPLSHRILGVAIRHSSNEDYEKNMPQAMKELKKALELDPKYVPTYISIANTYMLLAAHTNKEECYDDALDWFNKGLEIEPTNLRLAYAMGNFFYYMKDYDQAIEKLEYAYSNGLEGESLISTLALSYNGKAYTIYQSGKELEQGLEIIEKASSLMPHNGIILGTKAELLYKIGKYEDAHRYIKKALELEPDYEEMQQDLVKIEEALAGYMEENIK